MASTTNGFCKCGSLHFELRNEPLFVHACHCLDCKRKTGSSFGLTCIVLESEIVITQGSLRPIEVSPESTAYHCSDCDAKIYRTSTSFRATAWLQTSCVEDLRRLKIGAHTFVKRKDDWLQLPDDVPQFQEGYERKEAWPTSSLVRLERYLEDAT